MSQNTSAVVVVVFDKRIKGISRFYYPTRTKEEEVSGFFIAKYIVERFLKDPADEYYKAVLINDVNEAIADSFNRKEGDPQTIMFAEDEQYQYHVAYETNPDTRYMTKCTSYLEHGSLLLIAHEQGNPNATAVFCEIVLEDHLLKTADTLINELKTKTKLFSVLDYELQGSLREEIINNLNDVYSLNQPVKIGDTAFSIIIAHVTGPVTRDKVSEIQRNLK